MSGASVPPASMTSASPSRMRRHASPKASLEEAQAVTTQRQGPKAWNRMAMFPGASFADHHGHEQGMHRLGSLLEDPAALGFERLDPADAVSEDHAETLGVGLSRPRDPALFMASSAATMANWVKRSMRRASLDSSSFSGTKSFTSPAIFEVYPLLSNRVSFPMPFSPALIALQKSSRCSRGDSRSPCRSRRLSVPFRLLASHGQPAVDGENLARDVRRLVGSQEGGQRGHVLRVFRPGPGESGP